MPHYFLLRTVELRSCFFFLSLHKSMMYLFLILKMYVHIEHPLLLPIKCLFYDFHALI